MDAKTLTTLRTDHQGCEIVALFDVSTGTVLAQDGVVKWPQEQLDDLCALAAHVLTIGKHGGTAAELQTATLQRCTGKHVFVRAAPGTSEVLCCVLAPHAGTEGIVDAARAVCAALFTADQKARAVHDR